MAMATNSDIKAVEVIWLFSALRNLMAWCMPKLILLQQDLKVDKSEVKVEDFYWIEAEKQKISLRAGKFVVS